MNATASEPILDVVIGCDCDPDRPGYDGARHDTQAAPKWRGVRDGVARLREIADGVLDDFGNPVRITWCIRSDLQMREIYGDCAWPAERFAALWRDLESAGDELAWHPHVWRWDDSAGCWYQEIEDADWIAECLEAGYGDLSRHLEHPPVTSRMGWEFHNNATMDAVRGLGIRADFSAIPGRHTPGCPDRWGSRFNCHVDWRGTPQEAYQPAKTDYRVPADGPEAEDLWELPMSVLHSRFFKVARVARKVCRGRIRALRELGNCLTRRDSAAGGNKVYITMPPAFFSRLVAARIRRARERGNASLITALHPDEMCVTGRGITTLYHPRHLRDNLIGLVRRAHRSGVRVRFTTPGATVDAHPTEAPRADAAGQPVAAPGWRL